MFEWSISVHEVEHIWDRGDFDRRGKVDWHKEVFKRQVTLGVQGSHFSVTCDFSQVEDMHLRSGKLIEQSFTLSKRIATKSTFEDVLDLFTLEWALCVIDNNETCPEQYFKCLFSLVIVDRV